MVCASFWWLFSSYINADICNVIAADSEAEGSARGGKRAKVGSNNSPPAVVYCTVHPSEPAEKYCPNHNMALCTGCKPDHCDCYHKIDFDSAGWLCCWKPEKFRAFAHAAGITATQTEALKKKSQDNCDEAVSEVVNSFAELKAKLDDLCTAKVAEIRKLCSERLKQLDVMHDELLVRVSQLNAAAALCESVKDKAPAVTVPLLVSLKPFDQLANATITAGEHMTCVNFRGELPVSRFAVSVVLAYHVRQLHRRPWFRVSWILFLSVLKCDPSMSIM